MCKKTTISEGGYIVHKDVTTNIIVSSEGWLSWLYTSRGLSWTKIEVICESEVSFKREWLTKDCGCLWVDWKERGSVYKDKGEDMRIMIICLQDSAKFRKRIILEISPCHKEHWS